MFFFYKIILFTANDFNLVDSNADSSVSYSEFEKWYQNLFNSSAEIYQLFSSYDLNSDNLLTVSEFVPLASALSQKSTIKENNFFKVFYLIKIILLLKLFSN